MKKFFVILAISISSAYTFAQDHTAEIVEVYGQEYYNTLSASNPAVIEVMNKYVEYGFNLEDTNSKYSNETTLTMVPLRSKTGAEVTIQEFLSDFNSSNFNPLKYDFFPVNGVQVFNLSGSNKVIVISSQNYLLSK